MRSNYIGNYIFSIYEWILHFYGHFFRLIKHKRNVTQLCSLVSGRNISRYLSLKIVIIFRWDQQKIASMQNIRMIRSFRSFGKRGRYSYWAVSVKQGLEIWHGSGFWVLIIWYVGRCWYSSWISKAPEIMKYCHQFRLKNFLFEIWIEKKTINKIKACLTRSIESFDSIKKIQVKDI